MLLLIIAGSVTAKSVSVAEAGERTVIGTNAYVARGTQEQVEQWQADRSGFVREVFGSLVSQINPDENISVWRVSRSARLSLDAASRLNWILVDFDNAAGMSRDLLLELDGVQGHAWYLQNDLGEVTSFADDFSATIANRQLIDHRPVIPLSFEPERRYRLVIAAFVVTDASFSSFILWDPETFRIERIKTRMLNGMYYGLVAALVIYNLALGAFLRKVTHLYFALFLLGSAGTIYIGSGESLVVGLMNPLYQSVSIGYFFYGMVGLFGSLFGMALLRIEQINLALYRFWRGVAGLHIAVTPLAMYLGQGGGLGLSQISLSLNLVIVVALVTQAVYIYALVYCWQRSTMARFWFLGITVHTWALYLWLVLLTLPNELPVDPQHIVQLWTLVDMLLLATLVAYDFRSEHRLRLAAHQASAGNLRLAHDLQKAKSNFVATVGHDLRGPTQAISHFVEALRGDLPGTHHESLGKIDDNIVRITELINNMVRLSETEWQGTKPSMQRVVLSQVLYDITSEYAANAAAKGLALECDSTESIVNSDRVCLVQLLRNLVDNAIKYTDEGTVRIGVEEKGDYIFLSIEDTGRGIPADELPKIFSEFYQVGDKDGGAGVGLGLSIVARLTRLLGIEMSVGSTPGEGSRFELRLSQKVADAAPGGGGEEFEEAGVVRPQQSTLTGRKIYIVGDASDDFEDLSRLLVNWGADLSYLKTFQEAIRFTSDESTRPDLLLLHAQQYQSMESSLQEEQLASLLSADIPWFVVGSDLNMPIEELRAGNHSLVSPTISPMKFRALTQRTLGAAI